MKTKFLIFNHLNINNSIQISNFKFQIIFVVFLLIFGIVGRVYAQESGSESAQATESSKVNYELSYPGLLPDHPMYFLKAAREQITAFFISNPLKKSEFDLLQADKRIESSLLLIQKGKIALAESTFSKGENYFEDAINRASDAKSQGTNILEIANKLKDANLKHQEVLGDIEKKLGKKKKGKFMRDRTRILGFEKRANELATKK